MIGRIVVIVGVILLAILAWKASQKKSDVGEDFRFAVPQIGEVAKITITDRSGRIVRLQRGSGHWTFNESYRAREDAIFNLLKTIQQMELAYIPGPQALKNIVKGLSSQGVKVIVSDEDDNVLKSYHVGGSTPDERGTYVIMEGASQPAVVTLPNFEGSLRTRFEMSDQEWRDRIVFRYSQEEIKELRVSYPNNVASSFVIYGDPSSWHVRPLSDELSARYKNGKPGAAEAYLRAYKKLGAESIVDQANAATSFERLDPFCTISLLDQKDQLKEVTFYPIPMIEDGTARNRITRYMVEDQDGSVYLVQQGVFAKIFVGIDFFF